MRKKDIETIEVPVLPLRDIVVYPYMVVPLFVGRPQSINALEVSMTTSKLVLLVTQKDSHKDIPGEKDLFRAGTLATVLQLLKLPDGTVKVLVEGVKRGVVRHFIKDQSCLTAHVDIVEEEFIESKESEVLIRSIKSQFEQYVKLNRKIPPEIITSLAGLDDGGCLADTVAAHLTLKLEDKQRLLEIADPVKRLEDLLRVLEREIELLNTEQRVRSRVKKQMEKSQREYYLGEQMKAIQKELGREGDFTDEISQFEHKIKESGMSEEAEKKCKAELHKLKMMSPMSAEATVCRSYLDWMLSLPWKKSSKLRSSLADAEKILEKEHYGLKEVKERILEYLAVQKRVKKPRGTILCLVGPPGVGKTSVGQSIAHATKRKFIRMSLGGIRDEAEIRGHRRTYIGSMPGKIIQKIAKTDVCNPFFLLDEIDKMSMDFRGDPSSALLEVLDPEQNNTFNDHYLEVDYDLSNVMFVATANTLNIPPPLLDRMEVIRLHGYTEDEKVNIAMRHLVAKQLKLCGLKASELKISENVIKDIVRYYTREAGVRNLERSISKIYRKAVKEILLNPKLKNITITTKNLEKYLGVRKFRYDVADQEDQIGQVKGLAWTEVGGELLTVEAVEVPGKGKAIYTGQLGDVMQESIQAAMTVVRSRSKVLGIAKDFFDKHDIHIHVPEGATPKDGPSAGITMCTALVSVITKLPVCANIAMTGEITLRGEVLPIGGLKEKLLAAKRGNIKTVIIPDENVKDLKEVPDNIKHNLKIISVKWIDDVLKHTLSGYEQYIAKKKAKK